MKRIWLAGVLCFSTTALAGELAHVDVAALRCESATVLGYDFSDDQLPIFPMPPTAFRHTFATDAKLGKGCQIAKIEDVKSSVDRTGFAVAEIDVDTTTESFEPIQGEGVCTYGRMVETVTIDFRNGLVLQSVETRPIIQRADRVRGCTP